MPRGPVDCLTRTARERSPERVARAGPGLWPMHSVRQLVRRRCAPRRAARERLGRREEKELLILDTHVWIWMVEGDRTALSETAIEAIEEAARNGCVRVSAISVWEVAMLETRGRISRSRPLSEWVQSALHLPGVRLLPLGQEVAIESTRLPGGPHGDPSDRILMASARGFRSTRNLTAMTYLMHGKLPNLEPI